MMGASDGTRTLIWHSAAPSSVVGQIVEVSYHATSPRRQDLLDADAVELDIESLDRFDQAATRAREIFAAVNLPMPPVLIRVMTCVAETVREATGAFDHLVGRGSPSHRDHVWFVGTESGLLGLVKDLGALRIADGVSCVPVSQLTSPRPAAVSTSLGLATP